MALCKSCIYERQTGEKIDGSRKLDDWAKVTGISRSSVRRHVLDHVGKPEIQETNPKGSYSFHLSETEFQGESSATEKELSANDVEEFLLSKNLIPSEWDYSFKFSEWEQRTKDGEVHLLHAFKVSGKRKAKQFKHINLEPLIEYIKEWDYTPQPAEQREGSFIICPSDLQIGKVDWNGNSLDTVNAVLDSFTSAALYCEQNKPAEIVIVDAGDIVENIYSVSSQLATNDLGLPHQISVAFELMLAGIKMLAPLAPKIRYVAVPSNHGQHRLGAKAPAGAVHEDWGLMIAKILDIAADNAPALKHLQVQTTDNYYDSLSFETSESYIGVVHGHQTGNPDGIGKWWQGQSHGEMPTAGAHILITGHWHSFRVQQSGNKRWVFVCPSSDRGSSWFTNNRGERSETGMLGFMTSNNEWFDLQIF